MYPIEIKAAPQSVYFTPAQSNAYYATKYARTGITIHWWGDGTGASNHDNIVNYFLRRTDGSVNYVLSDNKITQMVDPDNVAWTSQSGNPTTISIEHQPTLGAEGYKKSGWLVDQLEKRYGRTLTLYPHKHWTATACPGTIDLNRIRSEANKWKTGAYNAQGGAEMITRKGLEFVFNYVLGRMPDSGAYTHYVGKQTFDFVIDDVSNSQEAKTRRQLQASALAAREKQFQDLQTALANEQKKPPKEVIKTVTQIVEKPIEVIKEVPVYTHDEQTKSYIAAIYNYFFSRYKTFRDSLKK